MRSFYYYSYFEEYTQIYERFGLTQKQAEALLDYLETYLIPLFLQQGSDYDNIAFASLMKKSMYDSFSLLVRVLPLETTTRNVALISVQKTPVKHDCKFYVSQVAGTL